MRLSLYIPIAMLASLYPGVATYPGVAAASEVQFSRDIRPILSNKCFHCHGPDELTREADLRLDTRAGLLGEGDEGGVVTPGNIDDSELLRRVLSADAEEHMPPPESKLSLSNEEIALLEKWIQTGADWQQHWAFAIPVRPALPTVSNAAWPVNPIDFFILRRLEQAGWSPSPLATKAKLLRRVTLDLTGLPPTIEEMETFFADQSPDSYERVVDRLFASPRYGERMVWDWLDAARYADTNGYQGDPTRSMWLWRDWAIDALNNNMPFDQFTIEQLAGDLLPNATREQRVATGFNRNHMYNGEGGRIPEETRVENVLDRVETTGTVWLGLTLTCCRCHDHKFDPLRQREYYQLYAYFNNTSESGKNSNGNVSPTLRVPSASQEKRKANLAIIIENLGKQLETVEATPLPEDTPTSETIKKLLAKSPASRSPGELRELISHFQDAAADYSQQLTELKNKLLERNQLEGAIPQVMVMDSLKVPRQSFILDKGSYNKPLEPVSPGVPAILPSLPADAPPNRLSLAKWIVDEGNPLTARVTVNRFWQTFFGKGLVSTPGDLGVQGEPPSHPQLLDWLATELIRSGWDVKALQKLMVMSATYRQSAKVTPAITQADPENRLRSHGTRYRMPAWMIRDAALATSGLLVEKLGGPPVKPYQPSGVWQEASFGKIIYKQDHGEKLYRRSVYTFWRRIVGPTMFFDAGKRQTCSVKPALTNTPLHALTTLNGLTFVEAARVLAERVMLSQAAPDQRIVMAFRLATSRRPSEIELQLLLQRLQTLGSQLSQAPKEARQLVEAGESPRDEQLDPVEHAAYTSLCLMLLNLDESLTK